MLPVFLHSEILAYFLSTMRESKLKGYKSAFILSVVNNELFKDRGVFLYNAHHVTNSNVYMLCYNHFHCFYEMMNIDVVRVKALIVTSFSQQCVGISHRLTKYPSIMICSLA